MRRAAAYTASSSPARLTPPPNRSKRSSWVDHRDFTATVVRVWRGVLLGVTLLPQACGQPSDEHQLRDRSFEARFDDESGQVPVTSVQGVSSVLAGFTKVPYRKLPAAYLARTEQDVAPFAARLRRKSYYVIEGADRFRFLAGRFRINAFVTHDPAWEAAAETYDEAEAQYLLLDSRVPRRLVQLQQRLARDGHDAQAFEVREAFRHPKLNADDGGASRSRHIYGEAVDLVIGDIDRDGTADAADKAIVIEILDKRLIRNKGGIGLYPGTQTVHFDVRGHRARWDSY